MRRRLSWWSFVWFHVPQIFWYWVGTLNPALKSGLHNALSWDVGVWVVTSKYNSPEWITYNLFPATKHIHTVPLVGTAQIILKYSEVCFMRNIWKTPYGLCLILHWRKPESSTLFWFLFLHHIISFPASKYQLLQLDFHFHSWLNSSARMEIGRIFEILCKAGCYPSTVKEKAFVCPHGHLLKHPAFLSQWWKSVLNHSTAPQILQHNNTFTREACESVRMTQHSFYHSWPPHSLWHLSHLYLVVGWHQFK